MESKSSNALNINFDQLVVGYEFPEASYELNASIVSKYLDAVGRRDRQSFPESESVPPLAIGA